MNTSFDDLIVRHPSMEDAQITVDLMITCDIAEFGEPDSDLGSVKDDWSNADLDQDAWLACTPENQLVGYALIHKNERNFTFDLYIHPSHKPDGLASHLLRLCETRAQELLTTEMGEITATVYVPEVNIANKCTVEKLGYKPERYHFGMRIYMDAPPLPPGWTVEATLRNVNPGSDDQMVYDFIQTSFDRPGRTPPSFERWHSVMMEVSNFDPSLWFLAYHGEELIGAILCFEYPEYGWVRQLGVPKAWRCKGIGSALLQHSFNVFHQRGYKIVGLGVEAGNANAYQLYEKVGMKRKTHIAEYRKTLSA